MTKDTQPVNETDKLFREQYQRAMTKCAHEIFDEQVAAHPESIALICGEQAVTYSELRHRALLLAHEISKKGIVHEELIGIFMDRSVESIVAMLGILYAGGAYLPIDLQLPKDRIKYLTEDSGVRILLTTEHDRAFASEFSDIVIAVSPSTDLAVETPSESLKIKATPGSLMYVMYTSGSTGAPKGVEILHRGIVHLVSGNRPKFGRNEIFLHMASPSFDAATFEIWGALLHGSSLVVVPERIPGINEVRTAIEKNNVSTVLLTASYFNAVIDESPESLSGLKQLLVVGEALSVPHIVSALKALPNTDIINGYGPTENSAGTSLYTIPKDLDPSIDAVPIGTPFMGTTVYILDEEGRPVQDGLPGELYAGGDGVGRGYRRRPELTREKFLPDPFAGTPGATMYRTGDLALRRSDGLLEFLGRVDDQVKIGGFRIEPGEIQTVIAKHPSVRNVLVSAQVDPGGNKQLVAYIVPANSKEYDETLLRTFVDDNLPHYMRPSYYVYLDAIPLKINGKADRDALPIPWGSEDVLRKEDYADEIELTLAKLWFDVLGSRAIDRDTNVFEAGGKSIHAVRVHRRLQELFDFEIPITALFQFPSIQSLAAHFAGGKDEESRSNDKIRDRARRQVNSARRTDRQGIAVIGMSGKFPMAPNLSAYWNNLKNGVEAITRFTPDQVVTLVPPQATEERVLARGVLEDVDLFDAAFFGYTRKEAENMDPQHRVFLEIAWEALENAGYDVDRLDRPVGLFAGVGMNTYLLNNLCTSRALIEEYLDNHQVSAHPALIGNDKDFLATRVAYKLGLRGPALAIQTACSTSLVAVATAWQSLMNYQCDMALAGGVSISFPQNRSYPYMEGAMVSDDGRCRAFDAEARGMLYGAGAGAVLLKRYDEALADGDSIQAVILGAAINNDGSAKVSYMAPSIEGQSEVIMTAQYIGDVNPETISYIETHGTGTPLGDPIEIAALTKAFRASTSKRGFCAIGSVKTNIGHLESAAGVAGLIKTVLSLQHREIPASLNFKSPNPKIDFQSSPFFVNAKHRKWESEDGPRRAGVSAFGVGGTNAHLVLQEAPPVQAAPNTDKQRLIVLSARTETALATMRENLAVHFEQNPNMNLADAAYTLQVGRKQFQHRTFVPASNLTDAIAGLRSVESNGQSAAKTKSSQPSIVFMFPGQGAQYLHMGSELYKKEPVFRQAFDECAAILKQHTDIELHSTIFPETASDDSAEQINRTGIAQPAIFTMEYAIARLWMSWGIHPSAVVGHSIGEYAAAVIAEAMELKDALVLISARARMMQALPEGSMAAVRAGAERITPLLGESVSIAAVNSPDLCVVSGPKDAIASLSTVFEREGIATTTLRTSHAFHSAMMEPMPASFGEIARNIRFSSPKIRWISSSTGQFMGPDALKNGVYWVEQIRKPVLFADAVTIAAKDTARVFIEVGPGQTLCQLVRQNLRPLQDHTVIPSLGPLGKSGSDLNWMLKGLGGAWKAGAVVNWSRLFKGETPKRIAMPTYPFERKRYWIEPQNTGEFLPKNSIENISNFENKETLMQNEVADINSKRRSRILADLRELLQRYSGDDYSQAAPDESFMEMGFDSLFLTQFSQGVSQHFNVKVTFRQMLEDLGALTPLVDYLDKALPPDPEETLPLSDATATQATATPLPSLSLTPTDTAGAAPSGGLPLQGSVIERVIQQQVSLMTSQLDLLRQTGTGSPAAATALPQIVTAPADNTRTHRPVVKALHLGKKPYFGPFKPIEKGTAGGLTEIQQKSLDDLIARYNKRTAKSKAYAQDHRSYFCDPRAAGNFRQMWKEMVYPIVCTRSKGSKIWDIDGNEYLDITMGFGADYLGHSPDFVIEALKEQLALGIEIGPQSPVAGEVAKLMCEFTGMERVTFCNTGSEAVMAAFRVARTVSGREKVVYFHGDYHGVFDEVLGGPATVDDQPGAMPIAPGIPHLANMIVLEYGSSDALETIRKLADDIACVIVEPVQSRNPALQPREFLTELRQITREKNIALVFDEVITGFRIAQGGAQEYFGVKADMASYGKVVGGGMPIGLLAGSATYMDALDGGFWQYGDDSSPPTGVTFFAGTFVRHPMVMAAARASLNFLKKSGPSLQTQTTQRTQKFVDRLNRFCKARELPMRLETFSSLFYYDFHPDLKYANLLFYYLRDRGIHIFEGRGGFISIAHTDEDMDRLLKAFQDSLDEMQTAGFLPPKPETVVGGEDTALHADTDNPPIPGARLGKDLEGNPAWFIEDPERKGKYMQLEVKK